MKVLVYTATHYLDTVLPRLRHLARLAEVDLVVELDPAQGRHGVFDTEPPSLPQGLHDARRFFLEWLPQSAHDMITGCASARFASFPAGRTLHPSAVATVAALRRFVRERHHDVVHVEGTSPRAGAFLAVSGARAKLVTIHDPGAHPGESTLRDTAGAWSTLALATRVLFHSTDAARRACSRFGLQPRRTSTILLGSGELAAAFATGQPPGARDRSVLLSGRLSPYKGIEVLHRAAGILAARTSGVHFVVAGRPVPRYSLPPPPRLGNGCSVEHRSGHVGNRELASMMQHTGCVVLPYVEASQSGVLLTAYAFGTPVVAARSGGLPEYVRDGHTGLLIPPGDPEALAGALERVLGDAEFRARLSGGIAEFLRKELSWPELARQTAAMYASMLEESAA